MGRSEEWEIIAGSSLKPKVAGPSMDDPARDNATIAATS
jgi:hypothetical protein